MAYPANEERPEPCNHSDALETFAPEAPPWADKKLIDAGSEILRLREALERAEGRVGELEQRLATEGLPADLLAALRDPSIIISQDSAVFDLIASWQSAPSNTASGGPGDS